jgi:peptidoglycan glycosyltransferase
MGRRIRWLGVVMVLCFALILIQLTNIGFVKAKALRASGLNPVNFVSHTNNNRGDILASDGTILAKSVRAPSGEYKYMRVDPQGDLYAQVVGYSSLEYGTSGIEYQYNNYLVPHAQSPKTLSQYFSPPPPTDDDVTLTINPTLQKAAQDALNSVAGSLKDGAVVAVQPSTGAIEAMYSSPSFNPNALASPDFKSEELSWAGDIIKDDEGFSPLRPIATGEFFPPGSTSKVLTTSAVYDLDPSLSGYSAPYLVCTPLPQTNKKLCNDGLTSCGGSIEVMLPASCDPGYGLLGIALGADDLTKQAAQFGYCESTTNCTNAVPPIDLPSVIASQFPSATELAPANLGAPGVAYAAIGQDTVDTTALQNALIAAAIANGGVEMTPHLMSQIRDSSGNIVTTYHPSVWKVATTKATAAKVTTLMESVVTDGTASQVGFPAILQAAVKTGTAQTELGGIEHTDDWMIGFAPANDPKIAIAVIVPYQPVSDTGALVAGPIMKAMMEAALGMGTTGAPKGAANP